MALTAKEITAYIDRQGLLTIDKGKLGVTVKCTDAREVWSRVDVKVTPLDGTGEDWVSEARVVWNR